MKGFPSKAWGKLTFSPSGEVSDWHPLEDHCADVAACVKVFLEESMIGARLATLAGQKNLSEVQSARLAVLSGLHDLGKFNNGFQNRAFSSGIMAGHVSEALGLLDDRGEWVKKLIDSIDYLSLRKWTKDSGILPYLHSVLMHHGRPQERKILQRHLWVSSDSYDPFDGMSSLIKSLQRWFPSAWSEGENYLPEEPFFKNAFYGLVTLADWIASDTRFFPFSKEDEPDRMILSQVFARRALKELRLSTGNDMLRQQKKPIPFNVPFPDFSPRPLQLAINELEAPESGSITLIEAETGSGKTEAAITAFVEMYRNHLVDGMYFALPTRTAATQIHRRVERAVAKLFTDECDRPSVVLAVPGYIDSRGMERCQIQADYNNLWDDQKAFREYATRWASERPKKYIAGSIVVGTIDQVLLSALKVNHSHMRASALLRHFLVVDEVHASDSYMNILLREVLHRHVKAGGHALLMSATLGTETAESLMAAVTICREYGYDEALKVPYPRLLRASSRGIELISLPKTEDDKNIRIVSAKSLEEPSRIASMAIQHAVDGAKVLVIRNTVSGCIAVQQELEKQSSDNGLLFTVNGVPAPHHSRYSKEDRIALDAAVEKEFGKYRSPGGCVLSATQTVQQSLDLDADILISDICPMDILLQRAGRLHRHQRSRPEGFEKPVMVVLLPAYEDFTKFIDPRTGEARSPSGGFGSVYEDIRILEATRRLLQANEHLCVPADCRVLVEASVNTKILNDIVAELGGVWHKHQLHIAGAKAAKGSIAFLNISDWNMDFSDDDILFPSRKETSISTRLGERDRLAVFKEAIAGPFGYTFDCLIIPHWMCEGLDDEEPMNIDIISGCVYFSLGDKKYSYTRFGLCNR